MRTTLLGDVVAAARVLLALSPKSYDAIIDQMLVEAHAAHIYFKQLGRPHPLWGNGSLMGRAALMPQMRERFSSDPAYLMALRAVIEGMLRRVVEMDAHAHRRTVEAVCNVV